jgi:hypothetical protein
MVVVVTDSEAWAKAVAAGLGDWDSAAVLCAVSFALGSEQLSLGMRRHHFLECVTGGGGAFGAMAAIAEAVSMY